MIHIRMTVFGPIAMSRLECDRCHTHSNCFGLGTSYWLFVTAPELRASAIAEGWWTVAEATIGLQVHADICPECRASKSKASPTTFVFDENTDFLGITRPSEN